MTHPVLRTPSPLPPWVPLVFGLLTVITGLRTDAEGRLYAMALFVFGVVSVVIAWPRKVEVGLEGLRIRPILGVFGRMVPYTTVRLAAPDGPRKLDVTLQDGNTFRLHTGPFDHSFPKDLLDRFWKAIAAGAEDGSRGVERQALSRSGRTTAQWRAALHELAKPATYRSASVSRDRLWTIAENPGVDVEVRGGAIVALSSLRDEATQARLREIDATTLHPALHALLDHAANGDGHPETRILDQALDNLST